MRLLLLLVALSAFAAACSDATSVSDSASVAFAAPSDGAVVTGPVTVEMAAEDFTIEPAGQVNDGAGHFHVMIDVPCVQAGDVIPADSRHLHFGDGATEATLELPPGDYTLCLQAGDGLHSALDLTDVITVTVE